MLEKAAIITKIEYSPSDKELKAQTDIVEKVVWRSNDVYEFDKKNDDKKQKVINIINKI